MPDGAVICLNCGYDKRTGRRVNEPPPSRLGYRIGVTVVAIAMALGVRYYFSKPPPLRPAPPPVAAAKPAVTAPPASNASPVAAPAPTNTATSVAPTAAVAAVTSAPAVDTNAIALAERAAREQEKREQLHVQFEAKYPPFAPGEQVALRMTNAIMRRGTFVRLSDDAVVVAVASNATETISFIALDAATRLRCDAVYRSNYVNHAVEKALKAAK